MVSGVLVVLVGDHLRVPVGFQVHGGFPQGRSLAREPPPVLVCLLFPDEILHVANER